jgi:hypothetical protein
LQEHVLNNVFRPPPIPIIRDAVRTKSFRCGNASRAKRCSALGAAGTMGIGDMGSVRFIQRSAVSLTVIAA